MTISAQITDLPHSRVASELRERWTTLSDNGQCIPRGENGNCIWLGFKWVIYMDRTQGSGLGKACSYHILGKGVNKVTWQPTRGYTRDPGSITINSCSRDVHRLQMSSMASKLTSIRCTENRLRRCPCIVTSWDQKWFVEGGSKKAPVEYIWKISNGAKDKRSKTLFIQISNGNCWCTVREIDCSRARAAVSAHRWLNLAMS